MSDFVTRLAREVEDLERQLHLDPVFQRYIKAKELLSTYLVTVPKASPANGRTAAPTPAAPSIGTNPAPEPDMFGAAAKAATKEGRIRERITALAKVHGSLSRSMILDDLILAGIMGHETKPMRSLASYLSGAKAAGWLVNDDRGKWRLTEGGAA